VVESDPASVDRVVTMFKKEIGEALRLLL